MFWLSKLKKSNRLLPDGCITLLKKDEETTAYLSMTKLLGEQPCQ
jgi:hypothetical protein